MTRRCWHEAAQRHYRDAEYLLASQPQRIESADHLLGASADSALNVIGDLVTSAAGARFAAPEKIHVNNRWNELIAQKGQRRQVDQYLTILPSKNPFSDWHVQQRYHCDGRVSAEAVARHKTAAANLLKVLENMKIAGVL